MSLLKGFQSWFNQSSPLWPFNQLGEEAYSQYFFDSHVQKTVRYRQAQPNALPSPHYLDQFEPELSPRDLVQSPMAKRRAEQQVIMVLTENGTRALKKVSDPMGGLSSITPRESIPTVVNLFLDQARGYINQGLWDKAIATCKKTLALEPHRPEAHRLMGRTLHSKGQTFEAMGCYADALALQPDSVETYADLGLLYSDLKEWEQAIIYYEQAIDLAASAVPSTVLKEIQEGLMYAQGQVRRQSGQVGQDADAIYHALSLSPETFTAEEHCEMGQFLVQQGDRKNAMECFHRAIDCQPNCVVAHTQLAHLFEEQQCWKESIFHYKHAIKLGDQAVPEDVESEPMNELPLTDDRPQEWPRSLQPVHHPKNGNRFMSVSVKRSTPLPTSAASPSVIKPLGATPLNQVTANCDASDPLLASIQAFLALARSYEDHGDMDKAITHYRNALSLDPKNRDIHKELTRVLNQQTAKN